MMLTSGWVVLGEAKFYSALQMLGILCSSSIVCIGIKILTMKKHTVDAVKKVNTEPLLDEKTN